MPVGYTALKTVASMDNVASSAGKAGKSRGRRGHAAGNHGKCPCCKPLVKVCNKFCTLSPLTQCLISAVVALFIVTGLLMIGGASLTGPASTNLHTDSICYSPSDGSGNHDENQDDPTVPLIGENVYAWYLANTGIIVMLAVFSSCVCCVSYVGLCCDLPKWAKVLGAIGIATTIAVFSLYSVWMIGGVYLVARFNRLALFRSLCNHLLAYVVLMVMYSVTVCLVGLVWCVWRARDRQRRERTTTRQRLDTTPKLLRV